MILDTVAFVRLLRGELSPGVLTDLESAPTLALSAASLFEINQKVRIGRLEMPPIAAAEIERIEARGIEVLAVAPSGMARAASMRWSVGGRDHRDPFDRIIVATALEVAMPVATSDRAFRSVPDLEILSI